MSVTGKSDTAVSWTYTELGLHAKMMQVMSLSFHYNVSSWCPVVNTRKTKWLSCGSWSMSCPSTSSPDVVVISKILDLHSRQRNKALKKFIELSSNLFGRQDETFLSGRRKIEKKRQYQAVKTWVGLSKKNKSDDDDVTDLTSSLVSWEIICANSSSNEYTTLEWSNKKWYGCLPLSLSLSCKKSIKTQNHEWKSPSRQD